MSAVPPESAAGYSAQYDLAFQTSPIILRDGIAASVQGRLVPISYFTPTANGEPFATYMPVPGSTLISQSIGMYPFANQYVAANATIQQPLTISLSMIAPVNQVGGYLSKLAAFSNLQSKLAQHNASGGMYIVATPAFIYQTLLLTAMTDITSEENKQKQIEYQLDFIQPILTLQAAAAAQSAIMQAITSGSKINGAPSWSGNQASSPATATGVAGALGNVTTALGAFGGAP